MCNISIGIIEDDPAFEYLNFETSKDKPTSVGTAQGGLAQSWTPINPAVVAAKTSEFVTGRLTLEPITIRYPLISINSLWLKKLATDENETLVLATHGFIKKVDKVPANEIERAKAIRKKYFENKPKI